MKTLNKVISTLIFVFGISTASLAQLSYGSANTSIDAKAIIQASLTVTGEDFVNFGTINTANTTGEQSPVSGGEGKFSMSGTEGAQVDLTFSFTDLVLEGSNGSGNDKMTLNSGPETGAWEETDSGTFPGTNLFDLSAGTQATLDADGKIFIWVKPTITVDKNQKPGSYLGTVELRAEYTGV